MENYKLFHNQKENRYEFHVGDLRPHVEYEIKENSIYLTSTQVPKDLRGQGIAGKLVKSVLEEVTSSTDMKVIPECDFVKAYVKKHPEWEEKL